MWTIREHATENESTAQEACRNPFVPARKEVTGYVADPFDRRFFHRVDLRD